MTTEFKNVDFSGEIGVDPSILRLVYGETEGEFYLIVRNSHINRDCSEDGEWSIAATIKFSKFTMYRDLYIEMLNTLVLEKYSAMK